MRGSESGSESVECLDNQACAAANPPSAFYCVFKVVGDDIENRDFQPQGRCEKAIFGENLPRFASRMLSMLPRAFGAKHTHA